MVSPSDVSARVAAITNSLLSEERSLLTSDANQCCPEDARNSRPGREARDMTGQDTAVLPDVRGWKESGLWWSRPRFLSFTPGAFPCGHAVRPAAFRTTRPTAGRHPVQYEPARLKQDTLTTKEHISASSRTPHELEDIRAKMVSSRNLLQIGSNLGTFTLPSPAGVCCTLFIDLGIHLGTKLLDGPGPGRGSSTSLFEKVH